MTRRYLYIQDAPDFADSRVIFVYAGISEQAKRDLRFVEQYAAQRGHFFRLYDNDCCALLNDIRKHYPNIIPDGTLIRQFVRLLKANKPIQININTLKNHYYVQNILDEDFRCRQNAG